MVYVLDCNGKAIMPCTNSIARLLLKEGKAKCVRRTPFTIKLKYSLVKVYTQKLIMGIDTGSSKVGYAVVNLRSNVYYLSQVEIRNDISAKMERRSKYRRNRRSRKTRYRKARWLNRRNSIRTNRFSPTMVSKLWSHLKEVSFIESILPIFKIVIETGTFDPHRLKNPDITHNRKLYSKGLNYGFENTKAYVLDRDGYTCQHCGAKSKNIRMEVHHIIFRKNNGSDEESNLITLCEDCHSDLHKGLIVLRKNGKRKNNLKHATQMNSIRVQLLKILTGAEETFGYITKIHRMYSGLPKEHYYDALVIANIYNFRYDKTSIVFKNTSILYKKCISKGDFQQTKGVRSEKRIPTGKILGFRKFDKVSYKNQDYFIKGRMSSGYAILMDIDSNKIDLKPIPKLKLLKRRCARKSWIISQKTIVNI